MEESQNFHSAANALFESILIGLWAAFENVAEDLWNKTQEIRPQLQQFKPAQQEKQKQYLRYNKKKLELSIVSYERIFGHRTVSIMHVRELFELEALRNLFAHKSGVVDNKFREQIKAYYPDSSLLSLPLGERAELDAKICRVYSDAVLQSGERLFKEVDMSVSDITT